MIRALRRIFDRDGLPSWICAALLLVAGLRFGFLGEPAAALVTLWGAALLVAYGGWIDGFDRDTASG